MFLRSAFTGILYYSGILHARRYTFGLPSVILAYHRVIPADSEEKRFIQPGMYVTTGIFDKQMAYIKKYYNVIALEELLNNPGVKNACIVTFDDGWYDNYQYAYPILRKHSIPATIFLATNLIGTNIWAWPDRISYYIHSATRDAVDAVVNMILLQDHIMSTRRIKELTCSGNRTILADELINYLKFVTEEARNSLMAVIDSRMGSLLYVLNKQRPWMTWSEINEMSSDKIAFGAHSHNHVILTQTNIEEATKEILDSRNTLLDKLRRPVNMFSYPNGNYNYELMQAINKLGFKLAVTTKRGMLDESENLLALRRVLIHNDMTSSRHMFVYRITKREHRAGRNPG